MSGSHIETRKLEIREGADVIVVGGGPGGVVAALAAARHGMKVLIIEKNIILGGLATAGHVCLFEPLCDGKGRKVTSGIVEEMLHLSIAYSYNNLPRHWSRHVERVKNPEQDPDYEPERYINVAGRYLTLFNVPAFALALEECVLKAGVEILYDTLFCDTIMKGDVCTGVIVENLTGRYALSCKMVIDGTGYSTVFARLGAELIDGKNHFTFECYDTNFKMMQKALQTGKMIKAINWCVLGWNPLHSDPGEATDFYGRTVEDINRYVLVSHREALAYLKKQGPDYAMLALPTMPQLRMNRRIKGLYEMRPDDVFKPMEDSIGCVSDWRRAGPIYEVPYRCMLDKSAKNVLAVGRNLAAQTDSWDIMRCYPGCMTTGQGAGTAAALALKNGVSVHELKISELQNALKKDGVILHQ